MSYTLRYAVLYRWLRTPDPNNNVDEYREMAAEAGEMWTNHGAVEYFEDVGDDLNPDMGEETVSAFPEMVKAGPDETAPDEWLSVN